MKLKSVSKLFYNKLLLITTIIPTALAILYFGVIASDVYVSESRFVVRSPERQAASPLGLILKGAGFSRAEDDAFAVQNFIISRDAARSLDQDIKIKQLFSAGSIDLFSRFSGLDWDDSYENFHRYYQKHVDIQLESASSIATLITRAYTADDAYVINLKLLEQAEALVNKLNERARQDMVRFAALEVADLENKAKAAALALARFRNEKGVIDPEKQSSIPLQQVSRLQEELIATNIQISQIEKVARDNPQLPILRSRASLLEQAIEAESLRVAGGGGRSLAGKASEFQRLTLERDFSDKMLASAMGAQEQARNEAQRKQLYLERIVQPNLADRALEPRRLRNITAVFVIGLIGFGVLSMLIAGIKEHKD